MTIEDPAKGGTGAGATPPGAAPPEPPATPPAAPPAPPVDPKRRMLELLEANGLKSALTDLVSGKVGERDTELAALREQNTAIQAKLDAIAAKDEGKKNKAEDAFAAERAELQQKHQALLGQYETEKQQRADLNAQYLQTQLSDQMAILFASEKVGGNAQYAQQAVSLMLAKGLYSAAAHAGGVSIVCKDPETEIPLVPAEEMVKWLKANPIYAPAPPRGAGATGSGPPASTPGGKTWADMSPAEKLAHTNRV